MASIRVEPHADPSETGVRFSPAPLYFLDPLGPHHSYEANLTYAGLMMSKTEQWALRRIRLELANRHLLILIHGLLLFEIGIAMLLTGAPDFASEWFGPHARLWLGGGAIIPGAVVIVGAWLTDERRSGYWLQCVGLAGVGIWHSVMVALYGFYAFKSGVPILSFGEVNVPGSARLYIPLVYLNIMLLATVHLVTLLRLGRPPR
jgi:hypothetical protein